MGWRQPTGPASEASPGHPATRPPPSPRARTRPRRARPTVSGRRRRVDGMRGSPAPRPPPSAVDSASASATFASTPCALPRPLSRSLAFAPRAPHRRPPSDLPELPSPCSRHLVASQRLLPPLRAPHFLRVLGQAFFPEVSLPRGPNRSPESARPRQSSLRRRYPWLSLSWPFLASLAHALRSSWFPESREAALARSTGVRWPAPLQQRNRSAIAGGQLAALGLRASGGVGSSRKKETNALVLLVSAGKPHRRRAVDGDLLPSLCSGHRARLAGGSARQWPRVHCTGCT